MFLDCNFMCDEDYIRTEINYVNWVTDRAAADIHVLITSENTGGGGSRVTLAFLGRRYFAAVGDTLQFNNAATATSDETRIALTRVDQARARAVRRAHADRRAALKISVDSDATADHSASQSLHDPWNFWVFTTSLNGDANGDANNASSSLNGGFSARRTTDASRSTCRRTRTTIRAVSRSRTRSRRSSAERTT